MVGWQLSGTYGTASGVVRWDRFGNPEGEPLVLLHGTPFSSLVWRDVGRALAAHHQVYVWDMPGYGCSERAEGQDLSLAAMGRVFAGLLGHWNLTDPLVVAHDSGGAVALGAHLLHGAGYRRLALVDAVSLPPWGSPFSRLVGEHAHVFEQLPLPVHAALVREYVDSASGPGLAPAVLDALTAPWLGEEGRAAFYRQLVQRLDDRRYTDVMQDRYGTIDLPVLVCWGEQDTWVPPARGRELASRIPGARLRLLPGAGHLAPVDAAAELATALFAFLHDVHGPHPPNDLT
ncbi:alpha/beta fold hydrolase [Streptomyces marincola]|uniref:alpha/beta fold hydrolase n=1 Tax=Streptomyces marincola TaxID=2878388 RepID=UPI001CF12445|nr:alpha/beta hydrolase [Streptomyces marincola]UCM91048.1 alpha/beta hydrolase [Streptomyces marincola]